MATESKFIIGQRDAYFQALFPLFEKDRNCIIITADNGAPTLDQYATALPDQYYTVGIAEQAMFSIAAGLAVEGKKVWVYAIAPFVTTRVHEFVKLSVCAPNYPITILGVGAGFAYDNMGPSHHTLEDISIMRVLPNLTIYSPADSVCARWLADETYYNPKPTYIRFDRAGIPNLYNRSDGPFSSGMRTVLQGRDICIIATGRMVHEAIKVAELLGNQLFTDVGVLDLFRLKPIDRVQLVAATIGYRQLISYEEHFLPGGLGSIIAELMADGELRGKRLYRVGMKDEFCFSYGGREAIWERFQLDAPTVAQRILEEAL